MNNLVHPNDALFKGEKAFPVIPSCEHFAGSEKLAIVSSVTYQKLDASVVQWIGRNLAEVVM